MKVQMDSKPLVSILMNCYNSEKYLREAIDSIYSQNYENWEIIFIDNCSSDGSAEIAKSYRDGRLLYYKTDKKISLYSARNFGLRLVNGDYLAFLDTDDIWIDNKLEIEVNYTIEQNVDFICTGAFIMIGDYRNISLRTWPSRKIDFKMMLEKYQVNIQTVFLNMKKVNKLKFDDRINIAGDYDFFLRYLHQDNINAVFLEEPTVYYRIHDNNLSKESWASWAEELVYIYENIEPLCSEYEKYLLHMHWDKRRYKSELMGGNCVEARQAILPYISNGIKEKLMYLIAFFPFSKQILIRRGWQ
jgi:glycosyltransferase involved in cell wall biosynthesis